MEENSEDNKLEKDEEFGDDDQSPESRSSGKTDYVKGTVRYGCSVNY